ncbi:ABC transporter permease [Streptomyces luteireticuli]|uniref:Autoinducer 2 import system permease protein LsrC n=1 Tax=Streptomyces luteireticuli TaxID=173858 RepID=A0ABP3J1W9_9ACTN
MAATVDAPPAAGPGRRGSVLAHHRGLSLLPVLLVLGVAGFVVSPAFLTSDNLVDVAQSSTELGLLVLAESLVLVAGRMDLSLESTVGVAPVVAMWLVLPSADGRFGTAGLVPGAFSVPLCLLAGALIGGLNAFLILVLRLNGFIVTLGGLTMWRGLQIAVSEGQSVVDLPGSFTYLGRADWLGVPAAIWITGLLFLAGGSALAWFRHGRALYAIGGNAEAARTAGIRVDRVVCVVLVLAGVLAAFAGVLYAGHYGAVSAGQGSGWIFQVFAACVIGGVSLDGGKGTLFGALTGVLTLQLVVNIMTLAGVPPLWNQFLNGGIIIAALVVSRFASGEKQE